MTTKIIFPSEIIAKTTQRGKDFLSIKAKDGLFYQVWEPKLFDYFQKNKSVKVKIEQKENFNTIVAVIDKDEKEIGNKPKNQGKGSYDDFAKGQAKGACFNKSCDIAIAFYSKGEIKKKDVVAEIKKIFKELTVILE